MNIMQRIDLFNDNEEVINGLKSTKQSLIEINDFNGSYFVSEAVSNIEGMHNLINEMKAHLVSDLEWIAMKDEQPNAGSGHQHVDCYIVLKDKPNQVVERPWNVHHKCFDDCEYDDFDFSVDDVLFWMFKPEVKLPEIPEYES